MFQENNVRTTTNYYQVTSEVAELMPRHNLRRNIKNINRLADVLDLYQINPVYTQFILRNANAYSNKVFCIDQTRKEKINWINGNRYDSILNLISINKTDEINSFLETVNIRLNKNGVLVGFFEVKERNHIRSSKDSRLKVNNGKSLYKNRPPWGRNHRYRSKAEIYGRLSCYGLEIVDEQQYERTHFFVARKKRNPTHIQKKQYGLFIKLPRVCKNRKVQHFYKIRTMYPYSEYLQEYLYQQQGLQKGGKINDDFRISRLGRILRKYWIDELPMIVNLLKGDIKLVGVRPLSKQYFNLYSEDLQRLRTETKPGLIPPFYVDYPKSLQEIMESELKYLKAYQKKPFLTDIQYLFKAIRNILFYGYRSQ